jgi:hypothetical protein
LAERFPESLDARRLVMKRKALILPVIAAGAALLAAPHAEALRAEPRALVCPSQTLGSIDVPVDGDTVSGYVQVIGFALDGNQVSNVDVFVDGTDPSNAVTVAGGANINLPRPDVMQFFPQYGGTAASSPATRPPSRRPHSRTGRTRCMCASPT